jgi:hypothetical protein|tara:strand:- start:179 stop:346 length:168 start_codon:yes stop_codon:yes gene_type:complete
VPHPDDLIAVSGSGRKRSRESVFTQAEMDVKNQEIIRLQAEIIRLQGLLIKGGGK